MIEGIIIRGGNQIAIQERLCAAYISGLVSVAKADILTNLVDVSTASGEVSMAAWGHFCPYARDRIRRLVADVDREMNECLFDTIMLYERLIHRELLVTEELNPGELDPWDEESRKMFTDIKIDGKGVSDYVKEIFDAHTKKILGTCSVGVVDTFTMVEFLLSSAGTVAAQMDSLQHLLSLCFTSFFAEWLRFYNGILVLDLLDIEEDQGAN